MSTFLASKQTKWREFVILSCSDGALSISTCLKKCYNTKGASFDLNGQS